MGRLPPADENKNTEIADVFAEIAASRGWVSNALRSLGHAPEGLRRFASVGDYVRYRAPLSERLREIVILTTGRKVPYAMRHHVPLGLQAGLTKKEIDALLAGEVPSTFCATEAAVVCYVLEFASGKPVTDSTFQALQAIMSPREITDVTITSVFYVALAMVINTMSVEIESEDHIQAERDWQRKKVLQK